MRDLHSKDSRCLELVELSSRARVLDLRPVRRFYMSWMYCRVCNGSDQPLFVYGARHLSEATTVPTSLFVLPPWASTPRRWDCKGVLIPADRGVVNGSSVIRGPVALKFRDMRRVTVRIRDEQYECPRSDGVLAARGAMGRISVWPCV
jgi:hypothetical protein